MKVAKALMMVELKPCGRAFAAYCIPRSDGRVSIRNLRLHFKNVKAKSLEISWAHIQKETKTKIVSE